MADRDEESVEERMVGVLGRLSGEPDEDEPEQREAAPQSEDAGDAPAEAAEAEAAAAPAEPEPPVEPEMEIEWQGQKRTLRGSELREFAQKGFDYSVKTEQVARDREYLDTAREQLQHAVAFQQASIDLLGQARAVDAQLKQYEGVNWVQLADSDPVSYLKLRETRDALERQRNESYGRLQQAQGQYMAAAQQQQARLVATEMERLTAKLPEWRDATRAQQESGLVSRWLSEQGFSQTEVKSLADHRMLIVARKAWMYDQLQASKPAATKRANEAPKPARPGTTQPNQATAEKAQQARDRLRKTGRLEDAAAVLLNRMR